MSNSTLFNDSITGYITNISQENKKKKYYIKFTMQSENNREIDGWIFSSITGILTSPLGLALTNSMKNHTGLKISGKIDEFNGSTTFKTQTWAPFQVVNPRFAFDTPADDVLCIRDALTCTELCSVHVFIIDIRPSEPFQKQEILHTNTFIIIGDESGTCFFVATDLGPNILAVEQTYNIKQLRRKFFNGMPILTSTINSNISLSNSTVTADLTNINHILNLDLSDKKSIITTIEEIGALNRSNTCSTCKDVLTSVDGAAALVYCQKCKRHSLKKNISYDISTSLSIKQNQEKIMLWASGSVVEQLLQVVDLTPSATDTEIAIALLSNIELRLEYSELRKELISVSKP